MADSHLALGSRLACAQQQHSSLHTSLALPAGISMGLTATAYMTPLSPWMQRLRWTWGTVGQQEVSFYHVHRHGVDWCFVDHVVYQRKGDGM